MGGHEEGTNINYIDKLDVSIPEEWINKNSLSTLTMNDNKKYSE